MAGPEVPFDAGDPEAVRERNRDLRIAEKNRKDMIAAIMGLPQGRIYFYELLEFCGVGRNPFAANALVMSQQCGMLNVGQKIYADITSTVPDLYLLMMREIGEKAMDKLGAPRTNESSDSIDPKGE